MRWLVEPMEERDRPVLAAMMTDRLRMSPDCPHGLEFPEGMLPAYGVVARERDGGPPMAAATLLYDPAARMALFGWLMASRKLRGRPLLEAMEAVARKVPDYAECLGARLVLSCFGRRSVNRLLDGLGWLAGDAGVETKVWGIKGGWQDG